MGFSSIGGFVMMFFGFLIVITSIVVIYANTMETTAGVYAYKNQQLSDIADTRIDITNITYDNETDPDTITVYVLNSGKKKIDADYVDIYIDGIKIPRDDANRTISNKDPSEAQSPLLWDPDETRIIAVRMNLENVSHVAKLSTENSVMDTWLFTVDD